MAKTSSSWPMASGLPNVVDPEPHRPRLGFPLSLAGKCSTTMGCSLSNMTASLCIEGFRAWGTDDRARFEKCNCDFGGCENAEANPHYRIKRVLLARPRAS